MTGPRARANENLQHYQGADILKTARPDLERILLAVDDLGCRDLLP
jgi:hypothetical protein